jgi:transcriptional regulator with XRE-family HTH domain
MSESIRTVAEVLDREFSKLRAKRIERNLNVPLETLQDQAAYLRLDKAALSRFRSGRRPLTQERAIAIARWLVNGDIPTDAAEKDVLELAGELLVARRELKSDQIPVETWFQDKAQKSTLMLVEFREAPAIQQHGEREYLVDVVGGAIVKGQCYGILFPYHLNGPGSKTLSIPVRSYLGDLRISVYDLYRFVLSDVLQRARDSFEPSTATNTLEEHLLAFTRRLKLYGLKESAFHASDDGRCPAIGHRLFYVAYPDPDVSGPERWEWITSGGIVNMVQKETTPTELPAIAARYFPIVEFWHEKAHLPETDAAIEAFSNQLEAENHYRTTRELGEPQWELMDPRPPKVIVSDFLKDERPKTHWSFRTLGT